MIEKYKYKKVTDAAVQIKDLIEIILTTKSFNDSSDGYNKKLFEPFIEVMNNFIARFKVLSDKYYNFIKEKKYNEIDEETDEKTDEEIDEEIYEEIDEEINKTIDKVLTKIQNELKQTEKDKVLKNSVFAILKYCLESIAATTAATTTPTTADNEDEELLEESAQILDEDIEPNADEILSIKEFETTNNDMDAKNRSFQTQNQIDYYEKMNHDIQNIMTIGTEGQREVVNHIDPKSYFEEEPSIEDIDTEMDAEINKKPEVVVNVPETIVDGYSDLSRATVFVEPKVVKDNNNVDEIFYKNNRDTVDETMFLNYPRVMTEEEAEILGVMSPMKLAACAVLKYCSVPVKGFWSDTVWNVLKRGVGALGTGVSALGTSTGVSALGTSTGASGISTGVGAFGTRVNNAINPFTIIKDRKNKQKLDTNRKQASLAILKYCLGYEDDLLKKYEEEQKHRKQASLAILKYCLTKPVRDSKYFNIDFQRLREIFKKFKIKNPFSKLTFPEWLIWWKRNKPNATAVTPTAVTPTAIPVTPETILQNPSMAILKYCLSKSYWPTFSKHYWDTLKTPEHKLPAYSATGTDENLQATGTDEYQQHLEELKNVQFQKEQRKAAGYSILKYCLEELGKKEHVPQPEEIEIIPETQPKVLEKEHKIDEQDIPEITSIEQYQDLTQIVEPDLSPPIAEENRVNEETDKYKEPSLAVLKYCLENIEIFNQNQTIEKGNYPKPDTPEGFKPIGDEGYIQESKNVQFQNKQRKEAGYSILKYCVEYENKLRTPPTPENTNEVQQVFPPVPPTKEDEAAAAELEKQAAELKKEQEKQRQTAGFSMLKYCLDFIKEQSMKKQLLIIKRKGKEKKKNKYDSELEKQAAELKKEQEKQRQTAGISMLKYCLNFVHEQMPTKLPDKISEYNKKLLAAIGLKFYLDFKDEDDLSSTNNSVETVYENDDSDSNSNNVNDDGNSAQVSRNILNYREEELKDNIIKALKKKIKNPNNISLDILEKLILEQNRKKQ